MDKQLTVFKANSTRPAASQGWDAVSTRGPRADFRRLLVVGLFGLLAALAGCESDEDCLNCVELPPPVVPTGVHSISGNNEVIVQWYDIAYAPYDDSYNENVTSYAIYSRFYDFGDEFDPNREFYFIGEVAWNENYDPSSGLHWFIDADVENGRQYEYAVAAVNAAGRESALSFEFVADAPLPMSPLDVNGWFTPVRVHDSAGVNSDRSCFNFGAAAAATGILDAGVVAPASYHNIRIEFDNGIAYALADPATTQIQDFGVFLDASGHVIFEGVSWAPENGYSRTGRLELVTGHVYVVEIVEPGTQELHYAKFGIERVNASSVDLIWAYQLIANLPELQEPDEGARDEKPVLMKL
ncbi:hypothetical protein KDM41_01865 [bacterium]|nr:hypothetical protein [bacterium]